MGFRTVVITQRAKLEHRLGFMVVRGEEERQIHIREIHTLILQSTAVSLTAALLCELVKNGVKVVFCDEKCSPHSELLPYYASYNSAKKIRLQTDWSQQAKDRVWQSIIIHKILRQAELLFEKGHPRQGSMLTEYSRDVTEGDRTNREGHAAKVYFHALFGENFSRGQDCPINGMLNYAYAILLSAFNREVAAAGYLTQLGIWHKNEFNDFNLSCDLMEPFRPIADHAVLSIGETEDFKPKLQSLLCRQVRIDGQSTTMDVAIKQYTQSVLHALLQDDSSAIKFVEAYDIS